jgi:acyl dehydratase
MSPSRSDLTVGEELPHFTDKPLTVTDFVRYQGASGDMNPIHHDTEFAQRSGFPTPFAVGMLQAGVLATYLTDRFGASAIRRFKVKWKEQAWPGDVLTYSAVVVGTRQEDGQSLVDLEASVTRQTGGIHLLGWATFVVQ